MQVISPQEGTAPASSGTTPHPIVAAQHVSLVLGSAHILRDISFTIQPGETVAIMGANGSGKSTLVRTILGIYKPTHGSITINGTAHGSRALDYRTIGYVPQRTTPSSGIPATAEEVVRSGLLSRGHLFADRGSRARRKALDALDTVGLADRAHDHVQIFSGGQAQRVAIARALVREPHILILDEPLAGIDAESRQTLAHILNEQRAHGVTHLIVLHDAEELAPLLDRVIYLQAGEIVYDGKPDGLAQALTTIGLTGESCVMTMQHMHSAHHVDSQRHDTSSHHHPPRPVRHHAPQLTGGSHEPTA